MTSTADDPVIEVEVSLVFPRQAVEALDETPVDGLTVAQVGKGDVVYRGRRSVVFGYLTGPMDIAQDELEDMVITVDGKPTNR